MRATHLLTLAGCLLLAAAGSANAGEFPWAASLPQAMKQAEQQGKLVLIHFWSTNCSPCQRMESYVFSRDEVAASIIANYVPVKIDAMQQRDLAKKYGVNEWPNDIIINPYGKKIAGYAGFREAPEYMSLLAEVSHNYRTLIQPEVFAADGPTNSAVTVGEQSAFQQAQYSQYSPQYAPPAGDTYQGRGPQPSGTPWQGAGGSNGAGGSASPYPQGQYPPAQNSYGQNQDFGSNQYSPNQYPANQYNPPGAQPWPQSTPPQNPGGDAANRWQSQAGGQPGGAAPPNGQMIDNPFRDGGAAPRVAQRQQDYIPPQGGIGPPPQNQFQPPAQHPPLALDGYCPVTVIEGNAWRKGDPRFGAVHRGRTYLFTSAESQRRFLERPDYYSPVFAGFDPVRYLETGELVAGKRNFGVFYDTMYLFADQASRDKFERDPVRYSGAIRQAMSQFGIPQRR